MADQDNKNNTNQMSGNRDPSKISFITTDESTNVTTFKYYPDTPTSTLHKYNFETKEPSKFYEPCKETSQMSMRCMTNNPDDYKTVCKEFFDAYRECKREWLESRKKNSEL